MKSKNSIRTYEKIAAAGRTAAPLRPGGLGLTDRALTLCAFSSRARVLDVGCGTATSIEYLSAHFDIDAVGVDPSPFLLIQGKRRNGTLQLVRALGENLPFRERQWDAVLLECSLSLATDAFAVLRECGRILRTSGRLIISDVYFRNPRPVRDSRCLTPTCCLDGARTRREMETLLRGSGFRTMLWEDHSIALKEFAAELILADIPLESFLTGFPFRRTGSADECGASGNAVINRPGYFLLVASKHSDHA